MEKRNKAFLIGHTRLFARIFILVVIVFGVSRINLLNVFAYTESMSTSGNVSIELTRAGNEAGLGVDNLVINSTCPSGYTVSIAGPSDNDLYRGGDNTSRYTISATTGTPANPVSILGNNYGTWGYNVGNGITINSNFIGLTNNAAQIATKASASASGGDTIPVYFGASTNTSSVSGTYTLTESSQGANDDVITYYLTTDATCANYFIQYDDNGANSPTTMSINHEVVDGDEVTLVASNFKRSGYGFAGWSTVELDPDAATFQADLADAISDGDVYGPNETITVDTNLLSHSETINGQYIITLYEIWVKPATGATLQSWRSCNSLSIRDVIALTDSRDNQAYAVAKLADGNCWMIENLRLEAANSVDSTKAQGFGGVFTGLANAESANFTNSTVANSRYNTSNITGNNQGFRFPRYNNVNTNSTVSDMVDTDANIYSYGNYYSWAAAIANTSDFTTTSASESANTSLCPTGWKLPYGGNTGNGNASGGFYYLNYKVNNDSNVTNAVASKKIRAYPNNFVYSGGADDDWVYRGENGFYWTTSTHNYNFSYAIYLNNTRVDPGMQYTDKGVGGLLDV